jgi:hypothetical protein
MNSIQASKSIIDTWNSIIPVVLSVIFLPLVHSMSGDIGFNLLLISFLTYPYLQELAHKFVMVLKQDSNTILLTPYKCAKKFQQSYGPWSKFFLGFLAVILSVSIFKGVEVLFSTTMLLAIFFIHWMAVSRKFLTIIYKYISKTFKKFISFFTRKVCTFTFLNFKKNIPPQIEFPKFRISRPPRTCLA